MKQIKEINRQFTSGFRTKILLKPKFKQNFFGLIVDFGSSDPQKKPGSAHYLEHLLFNKKDGDLSLEFEALGADVNAFTSYNETMFYCVGVDHLPKLVRLLFKLVGQADFTAKNVQKEQPIILQELMMYQDQPNWIINSQLMQELFAKTNLGIDVLGTKESIKSIKKADLVKAYQENYLSTKISFVACGDFTNYQIKNLLRLSNQLQKKYFKSALEKNAIQKASPGKMRDLTIETSSDTRLFGLGVSLPKFKKVLASLDLAQIVLEIMLESRLSVTSPFFERMRQKNLLDAPPQISVNYTRQGNFLTIFAVSQAPKEVLEAIKKELTSPIDPEKLSYYQQFLQAKKKEYLAQNLRRQNDLANLAIQKAEAMLNHEDIAQNLQALENMNVQTWLKISQNLLTDCQFCSVVSKKEA